MLYATASGSQWYQLPLQWYIVVLLCQDAGGDCELISGHSTADALRILHAELQDVLQAYQADRAQQSMYYRKKLTICLS